MSLGYSNGDVLGTGISLAYYYYPKLDGNLNNEKGFSGVTNEGKGSAESVSVGIPFASIPVVGDAH